MKTYFLIYPDEQFVGVDEYSGGYPFPTELWYATPFFSLESANNYCKMFSGCHFSVIQIEYQIVKVG